jgi:hypothetical protein
MLMRGDRSNFPAAESIADSRGDQATVLYEAQVELVDGPLDQEFLVLPLEVRHWPNVKIISSSLRFYLRLGDHVTHGNIDFLTAISLSSFVAISAALLVRR